MQYQVRNLDIVEDKNAVLQFWQEVKSESLVEKYQWIYADNPFGRACLMSVRCRGTKQIVGILALNQRKFQVNGKTYRCAVAGDFLIHPKHRTVGPALFLQHKTIKCVDDNCLLFIYGFPNKTAALIMERVGYRSVGKVLRLTKAIKSAAILNKYKVPKILATLIAPVCDLGIRLCSRESWQRLDKKTVCRYVEKFDNRFDTFSRTMKAQFRLFGHRSASYLNWKYVDCPYCKYRIYGAFDDAGREVKGYLIYRCVDKHVYIRDFALGLDGKSNRTMLATFFRKSRKDGNEKITLRFLENQMIVSLLKRFNFFTRPQSKQLYLYSTNPSIRSIEDSMDVQNWFLTIGDQDD